MKDFNLARPEKVSSGILDLLETLSEAELMAARSKIDRLIDINIGNLNIGEELGLQFRKAQILFDSVADDKNTPLNQKAQLFNSLQSMLEKLTKARGIVFSQERLKRYEKAVLKLMEKLENEEAKQAFFDLYKEYLEDTGT